tara:strand:- start:600 stop:1508 length:909 start_codon:yes stop_codon:yes gene_type:complete
MTDYYKILTIKKDASTKEIKRHYYQLAKQYHPDKNNGDKQKCEEFKLLSEAYSTLSNPKKRYLYDLKIQYQLNDEFNLNLSDDEFELLHSYYEKIMNSTEIKFLKLLYNSLPVVIQTKVKEKFQNIIGKTKKSERLIHLKNIKYIDASKLERDYILNLFFKFNDIYNSIVKQIILICKYKIYYLFINEFNYKIMIKNTDNSFIKINIIGNLLEFKKDKYDLIYEQIINLYQYYYGDSYSLQLGDQLVRFSNKKDTIEKKESLGLINPKTGKRGSLYIIYKLDLAKNKINSENKHLIENIFGN